MKMLPILGLAGSLVSGLMYAGDAVPLPKGVPPVVGTAVAMDSPIALDGKSEQWTVKLTVPKVVWNVAGEKQPKREWPEFKVDVQEAVLTLSMGYHPATQLGEFAQNRIVDLNGRRLTRAEAMKNLKSETPVLVSVSGRMPDPFYLQCTKPDALIVILGIDYSPAPELLPQKQEANSVPQTQPGDRTKK
jgi:hypothetical protein